MPAARTLRSAWPAFAAAVSALMLAAAHAFETFGGYAPCNLCLRQREVYWAALALALAGLVVTRLRPRDRTLPGALALMLAAIFFTGMMVAGFHAGVEWKWWPGPASCTGLGGGVSSSDLTSLLHGAKVHPPACDQAAWRLFGVSMAGYNAMISAGLALIGFAAAFAPRQGDAA